MVLSSERYSILRPEVRQDPNNKPRLRLRSQFYRAKAHKDLDAIASLMTESVEALSIRQRKNDAENAQEGVQALYLWKDQIPPEFETTIRQLLLQVTQNHAQRIDPNYLARGIATLIRLNAPEVHKSPHDIYQQKDSLDGKITALDRQILRGSDLEAMVAVTRSRGVEIGLVYESSLGKYIYFQGNDLTPQANKVQKAFDKGIGLGYGNPIDLHTHPGFWQGASPYPSPQDRRHFAANRRTRFFIYGEHVTQYFGMDGGGYTESHGWHFQEYRPDSSPVNNWLNVNQAAKTFNETVKKSRDIK